MVELENSMFLRSENLQAQRAQIESWTIPRHQKLRNIQEFSRFSQFSGIIMNSSFLEI